MSLLDQLRFRVESKHNSNFHYRQLDWINKVWLRNLCELVEDKLEEIKKEIDKHDNGN